MSNVKIEESWKETLKLEFQQPYFQALATQLKNEKAAEEEELDEKCRP